MDLPAGSVWRLSKSLLVTIGLVLVVNMAFTFGVEPLSLYTTNAAALQQLEPDNMAVSRMALINLAIHTGKILALLVSTIPAVRGVIKFLKEVSK